MPERKRVVVAMSGGVDSSVAAALLVEQGYEAVGVMLRLWSEGDEGADNRCCTPEAVDDARRVARALGMPFYLLNCERRFWEYVVEYFVREYAAGRTPNPCLPCNRHIKFGFLMDMARTLGAGHLATGHYARVRLADGHHQLLRGRDSGKDQSYFLHMLGQTQLRHALFPVGEYTKAQVRAHAERLSLPVAGKPDSQDICFIQDQDYRRFLQSFAPQVIRPGPILDSSGREMGRHEGLPFYTIGQRRGLGIAWSEPLYVLQIDPVNNALIVGPASQLGQKGMRVRGVSFVSGQPPQYPASVTVKVRYTGGEVAAIMRPAGAESVDVILGEPLRDITPGQAAVFYQAQQVLGGGIIAQGEYDGRDETS